MVLEGDRRLVIWASRPNFQRTQRSGLNVIDFFFTPFRVGSFQTLGSFLECC
jgi:hypothetical protein